MSQQTTMRALSTAFFLGLAGATVQAADTPNFLVIMADDLGYADLGCHGSEEIRTPNIDELARGGIRFRAGYVPSSVCGPSRACFLSGQYSVDFGFQGNGDSPYGIPRTVRTLPEYLKRAQADYYTAVIGKWHLGEREGKTPTDRGFDHFLGFLEGACDYFPFRKTSGRKNRSIWRNETILNQDDYPPETYLTDLFTQEAVEVIESKHGRGTKSFFLFLSYNAPHGPLQAPEAYRKRNAHIEDRKRNIFAAMMTGLDDGIGRVMRALEANGLEQETVLVFFSDNGGPTRVNTSRNTPFRGGKGDTWEGGIRIPFMIRWPARIRAGQVREEPVLSIDLLPTIVTIAGGESGENVDGIDLTDWLVGNEKNLPRRTHYYWRGSARGIRKGNIKWTKNKGVGEELFDILENPVEDPEQVLDRPELKSVLAQEVAAWERSWGTRISSAAERSQSVETKPSG